MESVAYATDETNALLDEPRCLGCEDCGAVVVGLEPRSIDCGDGYGARSVGPDPIFDFCPDCKLGRRLKAEHEDKQWIEPDHFEELGGF